MLKKSKRATKPTHQDSSKMDRHSDIGRESTTGNTGLAKVAVQCSADTFVVNQSLVLRINICGENRHLRQARNRYTSISFCFTKRGFTFCFAKNKMSSTCNSGLTKVGL
jgi:hypothetical protein